MSGIFLTPETWAFHRFPLPEEGGESVTLRWVAEVGIRLVQTSGRSADESRLGPAIHWAHLLISTQGPRGDWPSHVNARTGAQVGDGRTVAPAAFLERLRDSLHTTEFDHALERARNAGA